MFLRRLFVFSAALGMLALCFPIKGALAQTGTRPAAPAAPTPITTEIPIPLSTQVEGYTNGKVADLANYIEVLYQFTIGIIGFVAAIMMIIGGFQYLTSAGDASKIGAAKKRITDALVGLVLALSAYALLNTINPALLRFKPLNQQVSSIQTELAFLPFCEDLAKQMNVDEDAITLAADKRKCGAAGFFGKQVQSGTGTLETRVWCIWRGNKADAMAKRAAGNNYINDLGCEDNNSISGERVAGSDLSVHTLSVCLPHAGIDQTALNTEYDAAGKIAGKLGQCGACNTLTDGAASLYLKWPTGDEACRMWQNIANNGSPLDADFSLGLKKIYWDTRTRGNDDRSKRMYYCGYSQSNHQCVYVPILCHNVRECDNYDNMVMNYCEAPDRGATITCHANQTLGSIWGAQTGNAAHLIPVCSGDPCDVGGSAGCGVGGLAGVRNTTGIGSAVGGTGRTAVRVLTGGVFGAISCDAQ